MPNRIMRDDLLFSRHYWSVPENSQHLFIHLCLVVDDYGCFPAEPFAINAKCYPNHPKGAESISSMVDQLAGADLVRLYEVNGQQFLFIPRFRQRRRFSPKYPLPPIEISDLEEKDSLKSVLSQSKDGLETVGRQENTNTNTNINTKPPLPPLKKGGAVDNSTENPKTSLHRERKHRGNGAWLKSESGIIEKGKQYGLEAQRGESLEAFKQRVLAAVNGS